MPTGRDDITASDCEKLIVQDSVFHSNYRIVDHIEQFFEYAHLPKHLQEVSKPFCELANEIIKTLPQNPERTVALRKLLESKDAAVRAKLAK